MNNLRSIIVFVSLFGIIFSAHGQSNERIRIKGLLLDKNNQQSIPYAHIRIKDSSMGTVSNSKGYFQLVVLSGGGDPVVLEISSIGYFTKYETIPESVGYLKVLLKPDVKQLNEVVITAIDYEREFMRAVIDKIPDNYPSQRETLKGFFRELVFEDSTNIETPYYLAEAVLDATKETYDKQTRQGNVKLIEGKSEKGRNYDSLDYKFYAGLHDVHRFDYVARREGPLDKNKLKKIEFAFMDTVLLSGKEVFVMSFDGNTPGIGQGTLYISADDSAVVEVRSRFFNNDFSMLENSMSELMSSYERQYIDLRIAYHQYDDAWRFGYVEYSTAFHSPNRNKYVCLHSSFTVTEVKDYAPIVVEERCDFREVVAVNPGEFDSGFWDTYNTLPMPLDLGEDHFSYKYEKSIKEQIYDIKTKLRFSVGIDYHVTNYDSMIIESPIYNDLYLSSDQVNSFQYYFAYSYELSDRLMIGYEFNGSVEKYTYRSDLLTINYELPLTRTIKPWYLQIGFKTGLVKQRRLMPDEILVADIDDLVYYEHRSFSILPSLTLSCQIANSLRVTVGTEYWLDISSVDGLFVAEDKKFLPNKEFIKNGENGLIISYFENNKSIHNSLRANAGITWLF
ncbi:MAG: carboxypeptidase-like regulatory domain-containing protein [Reichenbachiella sp.]